MPTYHDTLAPIHGTARPSTPADEAVAIADNLCDCERRLRALLDSLPEPPRGRVRALVSIIEATDEVMRVASHLRGWKE